MLQEQFASRLTISALAKAAGASRTPLIHQFTGAFGRSPSDYLARVRVREGMRRLRGSRDSVDEVARQVGYQSGSKFYARLRRYTGMIPSQVRSLCDVAFEQLIEARVSLRPPHDDPPGLARLRLARAVDRRRGNRRVSDRRSRSRFARLPVGS
jgi:AraC-like DNA-binding protein